MCDSVIGAADSKVCALELTCYGSGLPSPPVLYLFIFFSFYFIFMFSYFLLLLLKLFPVCTCQVMKQPLIHNRVDGDH
uniref:Uncharacterized protein n=1 Tax=Physcomitrium patens TaxID=3218 RepID=A0A2K1J9X1_PHYPA|nr:hypothetical protein PHYPA_021439 [Physcomitrium patens]